jgi:hypothetical protein
LRCQRLCPVLQDVACHGANAEYQRSKYRDQHTNIGGGLAIRSLRLGGHVDGRAVWLRGSVTAEMVDWSILGLEQTTLCSEFCDGQILSARLLFCSGQTSPVARTKVGFESTRVVPTAHPRLSGEKHAALVARIGEDNAANSNHRPNIIVDRQNFTASPPAEWNLFVRSRLRRDILVR